MEPKDLLITDELRRRPAREPDLEREAAAIQDLSALMLASPNAAVGRFVELALDLCGAGSAGISLLDHQEDGQPIFRWVALAGRFASFVGGTTPRFHSPCGLCLDAGETILLSAPARVFEYFNEAPDRIVEGLIVPIYDIRRQPLGTIWMVAHEGTRLFDAEDARVLEQLAIHLVLALRLQRSEAANRAVAQLKAESEEIRAAFGKLEADSEFLRRIFDQAPGFMCVLRGPDHVFGLTNAAYERLVGRSGLVGQPVREALPELEGQGFVQLLDQVYATGRPYVARQMRATLRRDPDGPAEDVHLDFVYQPIADASGRTIGIFVEGSDVTERVRAEATRALLMRELDHRVRNNFATVQAVMQATLRSSSGIEDFADAFSGRLSALAKTQALLSQEHWNAVPLGELLRAELLPYDDGTGRRLVLDGPEVDLPAELVTPVGMAVHELTTNAAKHGALSTSAGTLSVTWHLRQEEEGPCLVLVWTEHGGPPVVEPRRRGFGTLLLNQVLQMQIGATVEVRYGTPGLEARITAPLRRPAG